jgi:hypothetical protein
MVNTLSIVRHFSASLSGLTLTWFVIHIPGEYSYASVWLMPTVAAFFAFAEWFVFMCRGMDQRMTSVRKPAGPHQQRSEYLSMASRFDSVGRVCIGAGVLSALIQAISSPTHCSWELPFAMGSGILIGVKVLRILSEKGVEKQSNPLSRSSLI